MTVTNNLLQLTSTFVYDAVDVTHRIERVRQRLVIAYRATGSIGIRLEDAKSRDRLPGSVRPDKFKSVLSTLQAYIKLYTV